MSRCNSAEYCLRWERTANALASSESAEVPSYANATDMSEHKRLKTAAAATAVTAPPSLTCTAMTAALRTKEGLYAAVATMKHDAAVRALLAELGIVVSNESNLMKLLNELPDMLLYNKGNSPPNELDMERREKKCVDLKAKFTQCGFSDIPKSNKRKMFESEAVNKNNNHYYQDKRHNAKDGWLHISDEELYKPDADSEFHTYLAGAEACKFGKRICNALGVKDADVRSLPELRMFAVNWKLDKDEEEEEEEEN